jgi:hypothetical protein
MTEKQLPSMPLGATQFRMRPQLQRLQIIFSIVLMIFSLFMIVVLFRRQEKAPLEYFLWVASLAVWCYAIWYSTSARLTITSAQIDFRAGLIHMQTAWDRIDGFGMEASGPVLYVQDSDQNQSSLPLFGRKNRRKKFPLYLFMTQWKTLEDLKTDPVGKEIIAKADWLIKSKN